MTYVDVSVDPVAFRALRKELFAFDRELLGKLNSRIKRAVEPVRSEMQSTPTAIAGWTDRKGRPSGMAQKYLLGQKRVNVEIGGSQKSDYDSVVRLTQMNPAAAIGEFARNAHTPQGAAMIRKFDTYGRPGRFGWAAMDRHQDQVRAEVRDEIAKTAAEFSARLAAGTASGVIR